MPHIILNVEQEKEEEERKKRLLGLYSSFMAQNKSEGQAFDSLDAFKESDAYDALSSEEQDQLEQHEGKNIIILVFDDEQQAMDFISKAKEEGLIHSTQADELISQLEEKKSSMTPRM